MKTKNGKLTIHQSRFCYFIGFLMVAKTLWLMHPSGRRPTIHHCSEHEESKITGYRVKDLFYSSNVNVGKIGFVMCRGTEREREGKKGKPTTEEGRKVIGVKQRGDGGNQEGLETLRERREHGRSRGESSKSSRASRVKRGRKGRRKGGRTKGAARRRRGRERKATGGVTNKTN